MPRNAQAQGMRGNNGTRNAMPRGRIPNRVTNQSQMYANDGVSVFGNINKNDLKRLRNGGSTGGGSRS